MRARGDERFPYWPQRLARGGEVLAPGKRNDPGPLADTVRDTLAWWPTVHETRRAAPTFTIKPAQEVQALADWHALKG